MSTSELRRNTVSFWRGVRKAWKVSIGVVEAASWVGLVGLGVATAWCTLKNNNLTLNEAGFWYIALSAAVISFRLVYEGCKYFRDLGSSYEH